MGGLFIIHVDDFIWAGTDGFQERVVDKLCTKFKIGKKAEGAFKYIVRHLDEHIALDQHSYIGSLQKIPITSVRSSQNEDYLSHSEIQQLRRSSGQINWVANLTRPDVCFDNLNLSVNLKHPVVGDIPKANRVIKRLHSESWSIKFPRFQDVIKFRLSVFCDASLANLSDGISSASGFIVFLREPDGTCSLA